MSWSFVGRQTTGNTVNGATTGTVTLPAGVNGGDFIVIAMPNTTGGASTTCSVTGFTPLSNQATRLGSTHDQLWVGYRVAAGAAGSATSDTTFAITFGATTWCEFDLAVWRSTAGVNAVTYTLSTGSSTYTSSLAPAVLSPVPGAGDLTVFGYGGQNAALSGTEVMSSAPTSLSNWPATCPTLSGNGGVIGMGWGTGVTSPGSATVTVGTATLATVDGCDFAIGVTETAAPATSFPVIQPGLTWLDLFKPGLHKPRPQVPQFTANEQGSLSIVLPLPALSLNGLDTLRLDQPQIQPGATWEELFKPGWPRTHLLQPSPFAPANERGTFSIVLPLPALALSGLDTLTLDQPQVQPGPTWTMAFKPGQPRPHPLLPQPYAPAGEQGAFSVVLPLPALSLNGLDTLTLDQPQVQPGATWEELFKPGWPRTHPLVPQPFAPANEQGTFSIVLPLPATALTGLDTLRLDQPQAQPGPVWLDLFKPGLARSRPLLPVPYAPANEQGTFSIVLPVPLTTLSGLDTLTLDQPQVQPGPTWFDTFKPGLPRPSQRMPQPVSAPAEQGILSIVLPLPVVALNGLDTLRLDQPQVQPGPVWLDLFKPALPRSRPVSPATFIPPAATESGAFVIELPPGFRYQNDSGPFNITLPVPVTALTGAVAHDGYFAVTLPVPATAITAVTNSGPFNITLPVPVTALTGAVAHDGYFAVTLPVPVTSLNSLDPPTSTGAFAVTLPVPATALGGPLTHQGILQISFGVPLPRLTRYEMFGCESLADTGPGLPVPVTSLAAHVPDPPGTRSYFKAGRWISARLPR